MSGSGFVVILLECLADIGNDVDDAETLSKLIDGRGIERRAGDKSDLVTSDVRRIYGPEE